MPSNQDQLVVRSPLQEEIRAQNKRTMQTEAIEQPQKYFLHA